MSGIKKWATEGDPGRVQLLRRSSSDPIIHGNRLTSRSEFPIDDHCRLEESCASGKYCASGEIESCALNRRDVEKW